MSLHTALVEIEEEKISSEKAKKFISSEKNGAESIFIGRVRNENSGKKVTAVTYDAHDQAVIKSFQSICNDAKNKFDIIIGMYHDQVLTPFKALFNFSAINVTLGLPYIRTSPDHGVAENIIGKKIANPRSLIESIKFFNYIK